MTDRETNSVFHSEPQVRHLVQLLEELRLGQLLIPKFQRPIVWSKLMRLALLDSILKGMPIGAITVWKSRSTQVVVQDRLGPFLLPEPVQDERSRAYVLDGLQRISTLYFALFEPEVSPEGGGVRDGFRVCYDLRRKRFVTRGDIKSGGAHYLPLTELLSGPRLTRFQRHLQRSARDDADSLIERSDEVADAFRQYKLPLVLITSEDVDLVTLTFERVNSQHVAMGEVHMVNTLAWSTNFDLVERLRELKKGAFAEHGWGDVEDLTVLRVCKIVLGLSAYERNASALSAQLKSDPGSLDKAAEHLVRAIGFLRSLCGVKTPELVPYTEQVVLLAAALGEHPKPSANGYAKLRDWFWLTTYAEAFQRQVSEDRFSQYLDEVCALARGEDVSPMGGEQPVRRPLRRFDFGNARGRALALLLAGRRLKDPRRNAAVSPFDILAGHGAKAVPEIVTLAMAGANVAGSPGARVLTRPEALRSLRAKLGSSTTLSDEFLASHVISSAAHQAFRDGDYKGFVASREQDLDRLEETKFDRIVRRLY